MKHIARKKQQGVVLIWALAMLLVLTILGVNSVKKATMGTKIAGNSMASMMVFQGAESALGKISNLNFVNGAAGLSKGEEFAVPPADLPNENVSGGSIRSTGLVRVMDDGPCPVTATANSSDAKCKIYQLEVESRLQGTGARTQHILGTSPMLAPTGLFSN